MLAEHVVHAQARDAAGRPDVHRERDDEPVVAVHEHEVHDGEAAEVAEVDGEVAEVGARRLEVPEARVGHPPEAHVARDEDTRPPHGEAPHARRVGAVPVRRPVAAGAHAEPRHLRVGRVEPHGGVVVEALGDPRLRRRGLERAVDGAHVGLERRERRGLAGLEGHPQRTPEVAPCGAHELDAVPGPARAHPHEAARLVVALGRAKREARAELAQQDGVGRGAGPLAEERLEGLGELDRERQVPAVAGLLEQRTLQRHPRQREGRGEQRGTGRSLPRRPPRGVDRGL
jgi:hypothetical protein